MSLFPSPTLEHPSWMIQHSAIQKTCIPGETFLVGCGVHCFSNLAEKVDATVTCAFELEKGRAWAVKCSLDRHLWAVTFNCSTVEGSCSFFLECPFRECSTLLPSAHALPSNKARRLRECCVFVSLPTAVGCILCWLTPGRSLLERFTTNLICLPVCLSTCCHLVTPLTVPGTSFRYCRGKA